MRHIGLLISQECSAATAGAIGDAFYLANEFGKAGSDEPTYRFSVLSDEGGLVRCSSSISIWTQELERYSVTDFHAFFVACRDVTAAMESDDRLLSWIARRGSRVSLRVEQGTTNLAVVCESPLPSTIPIILFEDSPSGPPTGEATPVDLALLQIERDMGTDTARRISSVLHTSFFEHTRAMYDDASTTTATEKIRESARWIRENYSNSISIAQAAESVAMSKRNFQRRFKCEFGTTPLEYLLRARFEAVFEMLRNTNLPVDKIARRCGMGDGNRLGRLFKERYGMSPTQFRAQQHVSLVEPCTPSEGDGTWDTSAETLPPPPPLVVMQYEAGKPVME